MIGAINQTKAPPTASTSALSCLGDDGKFDAALAARQKADAQAEASQQELQTIRETGFRKWVGQMQIEKLKEELRKKIMASMGLTDEDMAKMAPAIQQILEQKIKDEVEKELQKELAKQQAGKAVGASGPSQGEEGASGAGTQQAGEAAKKIQAALSPQSQAGAGQESSRQERRLGKSCPVIPALAWPGLPPGTLY
jgi:hypothetical protein